MLPRLLRTSRPIHGLAFPSEDELYVVGGDYLATTVEKRNKAPKQWELVAKVLSSTRVARWWCVFLGFLASLTLTISRRAFMKTSFTNNRGGVD